MQRYERYEKINMFGIYNEITGEFSFKSQEYTCCEVGSIIAIYSGMPSLMLNRFLSEETVPYDWTDAFLGPFILIIFHKYKKSLTITQHVFGNGANLFLCKNTNLYYFSSSLREMRNNVDMLFKLNIPMLPHYFYNGFLSGTHTLVEGVQKLEAGYCITVNTNGIRCHKISYSFRETGDEESLETEYDHAILKSINDATVGLNNTFSIALSGGYDSNCILYNIKKIYPNSKINTFSIGGVNGIDETCVALAITNCYSDVSFNFSRVQSETLDKLDEIVLNLEGSVYERGIFLQYELAKLLTENKVTHLLCGECADQVFHKNTYEPIADGTFLYGYSDTPYQMAVYVVLRKSTMMLKAFGIEPRYPFLSPEMLQIGYKTRFMNGATKEFHKSRCRNMFPPEINKLISKQGGSTDLGSLFEDNFNCCKELEKCKYYSSDFKLTGKYNQEEAVRDYYLSLKFLESFEKQFCDY